MTLNKPNPRLAILRAQLAAEADAIKLQRFRYKMSNAIGCSCPVPAPDADSLPLPPSYWEDLEHWLKTLAPAKPAAPRPDPATAGMNQRHAAIYAEHVDEKHGVVWRSGPTIPKIEMVGLWHVRFPDGSSAGPARPAATLKFDQSEYRPAAPGTKAGDPYDESKYATADLTARIASTSSADGAAQVVAKLTHSVCIKAHGFADWQIGEICPGGPGEFAHPENWLPCDEDGWVPHTPTADAVCPVPDGIDFEAKWQDGEVSGLSARSLRTGAAPWRLEGGDVGGLAAWRPIADGSK